MRECYAGLRQRLRVLQVAKLKDWKVAFKLSQLQAKEEVDDPLLEQVKLKNQGIGKFTCKRSQLHIKLAIRVSSVIFKHLQSVEYGQFKWQLVSKKEPYEIET